MPHCCAVCFRHWERLAAELRQRRGQGPGQTLKDVEDAQATATALHHSDGYLPDKGAKDQNPDTDIPNDPSQSTGTALAIAAVWSDRTKERQEKSSVLQNVAVE